MASCCDDTPLAAAQSLGHLVCRLLARSSTSVEISTLRATNTDDLRNVVRLTVGTLLPGSEDDCP